MKALLWIGGIVSALFSAMHVFITFEHWRHVGPPHESVLAPAVLSVLTAGVAVWAFRRARRARGAD